MNISRISVSFLFIYVLSISLLFNYVLSVSLFFTRCLLSPLSTLYSSHLNIHSPIILYLVFLLSPSPLFLQLRLSSHQVTSLVLHTHLPSLPHSTLPSASPSSHTHNSLCITLSWLKCQDSNRDGCEFYEDAVVVHEIFLRVFVCWRKLLSGDWSLECLLRKLLLVDGITIFFCFFPCTLSLGRKTIFSSKFSTWRMSTGNNISDKLDVLEFNKTIYTFH